MGLFAIGDLHFGHSVNKPMDVFGKEWKNHVERIIQNWQALVSEQDTVLIPGDISWGMREGEAKADLMAIDCLPGKKILLEGNHDYWWKSTAKLSRQYPEMIFLKNSCAQVGQLFVCGTRGWTCPNSYLFTEQDRKIYEREQIRLRLSLESAMAKGAEEILLMMHFPPSERQERSIRFSGDYP